MGNEYTEENIQKDIDPIEYSDIYVKYGIISKKSGERKLDDAFLSLPNMTSSEEARNRINFSLFGVFDGHNDNEVANFVSNNFKEIFENEAGDITDKNYEEKIGDIFRMMDKKLKEEKENRLKTKENDEYINDDIDEKEINYYKKLIEDTKEIPEEFKKVDDSKIKNLLLFRNLFKYNNNYLYPNGNFDYIGSSASLVMINNENIITADLGLTKCILFNQKGDILNEKYETLLENSEHTFGNKSEKKRIKKFNESIEYENLKLNIYIPSSRCFGLFKYKADEILREENQIISCIPKVNKYKKDDVDFILLMTKGMLNLIKNDIKQFIIEVVDKFEKEEENNIKLSELLNKYIDKRIEEEEKNGNKNEKNEDEKEPNATIKNNAIYVGKEDFEEENEIINELNKNYYKDIMEINKNNSYNCHGKYNITCILLKLSKNKKPIIIPKPIENPDKNKDKDQNIKKNDLDEKEEKNEIKINEEEKKAQNEILIEVEKKDEIKEDEKKEEDVNKEEMVKKNEKENVDEEKNEEIIIEIGKKDEIEKNEDNKKDENESKVEIEQKKEIEGKEEKEENEKEIKTEIIIEKIEEKVENKEKEKTEEYKEEEIKETDIKEENKIEIVKKEEKDKHEIENINIEIKQDEQNDDKNKKSEEIKENIEEIINKDKKEDENENNKE